MERVRCSHRHTRSEHKGENMGYTGYNTRPVQRRGNIRRSRSKLEELLAVNFKGGAQLVTLTYREQERVPSHGLAKCRVHDLLRTVRRKSGHPFPYVWATERATEQSYPVHRVVVARSGAPVAEFKALWPHGMVKVEEIPESGYKALAGLLMAQVLTPGRKAIPCGRVWSPSRGLVRPGSGDPTQENAVEQQARP